MTEKQAAPVPLRPMSGNEMAEPASPKPKSKASRRRTIIKAAFLLVVAVPLLIASFYLFWVAGDQYASKTGFVVRKSDKTATTAAELLGGLTSITQASSTESTILYEFIRSQHMVELVDEKLDLRTIYSRPDFDPIFAFDPDGSIEKLERYWARMVRPHFDSSSGLLELRVLAFNPDDARRIAEEIVRQSSIKINDMSAVARSDRTSYAREDLEKTINVLKAARQSMTEFRSRNRIVDPKADVQVQMGLISTLQTQLADAMIELDMLNLTTRNEDPRINQVEQRISVIRSRIDAERGQIGVGSGYAGGEETFSQILEEFESLSVDLEFAERAYVAALATYDEALAEANRQSLYLATYIEPTRAETSEYPRRFTLLSLMALFLGLAWAIGSLIAYSVWDRH
ncbi:sugar transporter [Albidovulum aquaemixtae]|uniref:sugar transporter n=1 Tax=Albidovulum aquaemixtae TaxID=1542388 RepID=UPI001FEC14A9|nr:sugar transporter [Defluviimonas aquaemixtae]